MKEDTEIAMNFSQCSRMSFVSTFVSFPHKAHRHKNNQTGEKRQELDGGGRMAVEVLNCCKYSRMGTRLQIAALTARLLEIL